MDPVLYFFLVFVFGFFVLLILGAWILSHWADIRHALPTRFTVRDKSSHNQKVNDLEPLPPTLQNVDPKMEPLIRAIHASVRRYKDEFHSYLQDRYYCTVRSKRYELRISLTLYSAKKYFLQADLEGKHPHDFRLENFSSFPKFARKNSEISEEEIAPYLKPLSFFKSVEAKPDILRAQAIVHSNDSMESWPKALSAFIKLSRYLMDSAVRKEILNAIDVLCPYCRGEFSEKDNTVSCSECKTRHHTECWEEVGRCAVFGCRSKTEIVITMN